MLEKPGYFGLMGHLARMQTLPCEEKVSKYKTKLVWKFICIKVILKKPLKYYTIELLIHLRIDCEQVPTGRAEKGPQKVK